MVVNLRLYSVQAHHLGHYRWRCRSRYFLLPVTLLSIIT